MVITTDGLSLAVTDVGPRDARACIFIHGIAQSKMSWESVLAGPLASNHRFVAFDLRGHGESDKPADAAAFARSRLANDLAAIITDLRLEKPHVVAWSFGAVAVGEYLRQHGEKALGGIVFVAGAVRTGRDARELFGPVMLEHARALLAEDPSAYAAGAREFLHGSTALPIAPEMLERALEEMLLVPAHVRRTFLSGGEDYREEISRTTIPMATIHGERDAVNLPAMSELIGGLRAGVRHVSLPNVGHTPWLEDPRAFHDALRSVLHE